MDKEIKCHDLSGNEFIASKDELIFRPSIYGVLVKDGKVLLSRQWDGYDFPGGGVNIDETLEGALEREFFEETGLKIKILEPVFCGTSFFAPSHSEKRKHERWNCPLVYMKVEQAGGELSADNFDIEEKDYAQLAEWVNLSELKNIKMFNTADQEKLIAAVLKSN